MNNDTNGKVQGIINGSVRLDNTVLMKNECDGRQEDNLSPREQYKKVVTDLKTLSAFFSSDIPLYLDKGLNKPVKIGTVSCVMKAGNPPSVIGRMNIDPIYREMVLNAVSRCESRKSDKT